MSMGTKMGARSAHFAEAEPTNRFTKAVRKMIPTIVTPPGKANALSNAAPFSARRAPILDCPNA